MSAEPATSPATMMTSHRLRLSDITSPDAEAMASRDGLFAGSSGNPVLPALIGRNAFDYAFTLNAETDRMALQLAGTSGFAVFAAAEDNPAHWVAQDGEARCFEKFSRSKVRVTGDDVNLRPAVQ